MLLRVGTVFISHPKHRCALSYRIVEFGGDGCMGEYILCVWLWRQATPSIIGVVGDGFVGHSRSSSGTL